MASEVQGGALGIALPALDGDAALACVDAQADAAGETPAHGLAPRRIEQGARAEDDALDAPAERLGDVFFAAQAAAELAGHAGGLHDAAHAVAVDRMALAGAVEIDEVQILGPLFDPATSHGGRIVAEDGFLRVIALPQPHTLAASQIDGRQDQHGREPPIERGAPREGFAPL